MTTQFEREPYKLAFLKSNQPTKESALNKVAIYEAFGKTYLNKKWYTECEACLALPEAVISLLY